MMDATTPPVDVAQEERLLLRQWARSPAWAVYKTRVQQRAKSSAEARASALRKSEYPSASYQQGRSDGLQEALDEMDRAVRDPATGVPPAY